MSVDPVGGNPGSPQSWNRYSYVRNNPIAFSDPSGELTAAAIAIAAQAKIEEAKQVAMSAVSDGSALGVVAATLVGATLDTASMPMEPLRAGDATGEAIGSGAGPVETTLSISGDGLRVASIVLPLVRAARPLSGTIRSTSSSRASPELINAMRNKGRTIQIAKEGSEELRYLDTMGAEANVGGPGNLHILLRENPSKAAVLEEFLHGTQTRLSIIDRLGVDGAEAHVTSFMQRHSRLLGLD